MPNCIARPTRSSGWILISGVITAKGNVSTAKAETAYTYAGKKQARVATGVPCWGDDDARYLFLELKHYFHGLSIRLIQTKFDECVGLLFQGVEIEFSFT